jgi:succinyl-diaminopimelate desuccinylase
MSCLADKLLTLVQIESVIGNEERLCEWLIDRFSQLEDYVLDRVGNSFALRRGARQHPHLLGLVGHMDTVPPTADNPARIESGRVFGLGSADMKSGLALMWQLLEDPVRQPTCDLAFVFYDGEEGPYTGSGLGPLLEQLGWLREIDLAICLEPSDNVLQLGCLGTLHAELTFRGKAAHSARPWQGENAIHKAGALLARLRDRPPSEVCFGDLVYREVISATKAEGGSARNVIPDRFVVNLNFRFGPRRSLEAAQQVIHELVGDTAEVSFVDFAPSGDIPQDNPLLERLRRSCQLEEQAKQAWTDVARLSTAGIAAVNFGPGENAQAHQPRESTSIALLEQGDALLRKLISA